MIYGDKQYNFDMQQVTNLWVALNQELALCENKKIIVKVKASEDPHRTIKKHFAASNKILCSMERIEDGLMYLNDYTLIPNHSSRNAFNFIEFVNCVYIIIHCIEELASIFEVQTDDVVMQRDCFIDFAYGNGMDKDVFEYIRSLCAVHPAETSYHPAVHNAESFDCCSRIIWDNICSNDSRDLTAVVYSAVGEENAMYIGIKIESIIKYLYKWFNILYRIEDAIYDFIKDEKERYRNIKILSPEQFEDYTDYIDNLRKEYEVRVGESHIEYFERYKLAFEIKFDDPSIEKKKECYKNAIVYMFGFLHRQLQNMDERSNTGICGLSDNEYTTLFYELYLPIEGKSKFSIDRGAFSYVDNLNSSVEYDVCYARQVLDDIKSEVNTYVKFSNTETKNETDLLLQIATYFDALQQDGYINRSIPQDVKYRGENYNYLGLRE